MRSLSIALLSIVMTGSVTAVPITPSAPDFQTLAERMRSQGVTERDISDVLSTIGDEDASPLYRNLSTKLHPFMQGPARLEKRDTSGDISPGSLEAPEMLPRSATPESFADRIFGSINAAFRGYDLEKRRFAYEGKESEMRRPEGMRHWNS